MVTAPNAPVDLEEGEISEGEQKPLKLSIREAGRHSPIPLPGYQPHSRDFPNNSHTHDPSTRVYASAKARKVMARVKKLGLRNSSLRIRHNETNYRDRDEDRSRNETRSDSHRPPSRPRRRPPERWSSNDPRSSVQPGRGYRSRSRSIYPDHDEKPIYDFQEYHHHHHPPPPPHHHNHPNPNPNPHPNPHADPNLNPYPNPNHDPYPNPNHDPYPNPNLNPYPNPNHNPYPNPNLNPYPNPNLNPHAHAHAHAHPNPNPDPNPNSYPNPNPNPYPYPNPNSNPYPNLNHHPNHQAIYQQDDQCDRSSLAFNEASQVSFQSEIPFEQQSTSQEPIQNSQLLPGYPPPDNYYQSQPPLPPPPPPQSHLPQDTNSLELAPSFPNQRDFYHPPAPPPPPPIQPEYDCHSHQIVEACVSPPQPYYPPPPPPPPQHHHLPSQPIPIGHELPEQHPPYHSYDSVEHHQAYPSPLVEHSPYDSYPRPNTHQNRLIIDDGVPTNYSGPSQDNYHHHHHHHQPNPEAPEACYDYQNSAPESFQTAPLLPHPSNSENFDSSCHRQSYPPNFDAGHPPQTQDMDFSLEPHPYNVVHPYTNPHCHDPVECYPRLDPLHSTPGDPSVTHIDQAFHFHPSGPQQLYHSNHLMDNADVEREHMSQSRSLDQEAAEREIRAIMIKLASWGVTEDYLVGIGVSEDLVRTRYRETVFQKAMAEAQQMINNEQQEEEEEADEEVTAGDEREERRESWVEFSFSQPLSPVTSSPITCGEGDPKMDKKLIGKEVDEKGRIVRELEPKRWIKHHAETSDEQNLAIQSRSTRLVSRSKSFHSKSQQDDIKEALVSATHHQTLRPKMRPQTSLSLDYQQDGWDSESIASPYLVNSDSKRLAPAAQEPTHILVTPELEIKAENVVATDELKGPKTVAQSIEIKDEAEEDDMKRSRKRIKSRKQVAEDKKESKAGKLMPSKQRNQVPNASNHLIEDGVEFGGELRRSLRRQSKNQVKTNEVDIIEIDKRMASVTSSSSVLVIENANNDDHDNGIEKIENSKKTSKTIPASNNPTEQAKDFSRNKRLKNAQRIKTKTKT
ncbi:hypothetical protein O181_046020 [Austropuccinia psidii MF-1]|uniref:Uncharacterized protein n=1 Tax=Austropuccinia psidii MF-1 TaxID=1389203 RepID=A0A9Q3HLR9_9BASI|nr:hypothetical protein [Austropuccinia psidii MF-1]